MAYPAACWLAEQCRVCTYCYSLLLRKLMVPDAQQSFLQVPEAEYEETVNKAAALGRAIDLAEQAFLQTSGD